MSTKTRADLSARSLWHRALPATPTTLAALALALTLGGCSFIVDGKSYGSGGGDAGSTDGGAPDGSATDGATPDGGTDGSAADALPSCTSPRMLCGDDCVDTSRDPLHCGNCNRPCGPGLACRGGTCNAFCPCEARQICLADGSCVTPGCGGPPVPTCTPGGGISGELPPMRLVIFDAGAEPVDVHVAQNPIPEGPGWVLLWRRSTPPRIDPSNIQWASASARADCYDAAGPDLLSGCDDERLGAQQVVDARTVWNVGPDLYLATSPEPAPALWQVRDDSAVDPPSVPSSLCAERLMTWGLESAQDLSITPGLAASDSWPPVAAIVIESGAPPMPAVLQPGGDYDLFSDPDMPQQVAANVSMTAFYSSPRLGVWWGDVLYSPNVGALGSNLVTAVNPSSTDSYAFFFATEQRTGGLKAVRCISGSGCAEVGPEISGIPGAPIAAYGHRDISGDNVVRFLLVEAAPAGGAQIRRYRLPEPPPAPAPPPPVPVLTGELVGGRIEDVIALDAEVIEDVAPGGELVGQLHVWAAVVKVSRGGEETVELWTGAYRQCLP